MEARNWRLIKIFATNVGWLATSMVGMVSWIVVLWWLPQPWDMVLGCCVPLAFFLKLSWDLAKSKLERQEMLEKRLLDQLTNMD